MEQINVFTKGMNRDIDPHFQDEGSYYFLENGDILTDGDLDSVAAVSVLGNSELTINWASDVNTGVAPYNASAKDPYGVNWTINGAIYVRDDIVLFYAYDAATNGESRIDLLKYVGNNTYTRIVLSRDKFLGFKTDNKIHGTGRYDNEGIINIYFAEKAADKGTVNFFRSINIAPNITNGVVTNPLLQASYTRINAADIDDFSLLAKTTMIAPIIDSEILGNLRAGMVMYSYRYLNKYGSKTKWSTLSNTYPLFKASISGTTKTLKGDQTTGQGDDLNSFKGLKITHTYPFALGTHEYIEFSRVWYSGLNTSPTVTLVTRIPIKQTAIEVVDTYFDTTYGNIDLSEFIEEQSDFTAKTMTTKDDRIYLANIEETPFELNFDARAYRFNQAGTALLKSESGQGDVVVTETAGVFSTVPADHDCICPLNYFEDVNPLDTPNATSYQYMCLTHGGDKGASGPHISIYTTSEDIVIGSSNDVSAAPIDSFNKEYILGNKRIFDEEEIYRYSIRFLDPFGRTTSCKWICDYRMPGRFDDTSVYMNGTNVIKRLRYPVFLVDTEGTEAAGYRFQIMYVKREKSDRTIVTKGIIGQMRYDNQSPPVLGAGIFSTPLWNEGTYGYAPYAGNTSSIMDFNGSAFFEMNSPEISFNKNIDGTGAKLVYTGFATYNNGIEVGLSSYISDHSFCRKLGIGVVTPDYGVSEDILASTIVGEGETAVTGGYNMTNDCFPATYMGKGKRTTNLHMILGTDQGFSTFIYNRMWGAANPPSSRYFILHTLMAFAKIVRMGPQYGGRTYAARATNVYIPASEVSNTNITATKGDSFVNYFELNRLAWPYEVIDGDKVAEALVFPTISSINTFLRHDDTFSSIYSGNNEGAFELSEIGTPLLESGEVVDYTPMFLYNSVYSKINDVNIGIAEDTSILRVTKNDCLVIYSDKNIVGSFYDNWKIFRSNNFNKTDSKYGGINYMLTKNNNTLVFQDSGISTALINPLIQAPSISGETTLLGTGSALERFNYITTDIGIQGINEAVESISAIYFLDRNKKKIYTFGEGLQSVTDIKNMNSWFSSTINENSEFIGVYDNKNSRVMMTIKNTVNSTLFDDIYYTVTTRTTSGGILVLTGDSTLLNIQLGNKYKLTTTTGVTGEYTLTSWTTSTQTFTLSSGTLLALAAEVNMIQYVKNKDTYTICLSEKNGNFTCFESFIPTLYLKGYREFYSTNDSRKLYIHNIGNPMEFYGVKYPMILDFVVNGGGEFNKILTAFEFNTKISTNNQVVTTPLDWVGNENETISEINITAANRVTEFVGLVVKGSKLTLTAGDESISDTVYVSAIKQLLDTSGTRNEPYPTYLYNTETKHNKFRTVAPRIKVGRNDSDGRPITEHIRGTYFIVRVIFNNIDIKRLKIHDIISYFDSSINF